MSKSGIVRQVTVYLEGRNRWLHAGNNNLPAYLSVMLGHGPQVDTLNALFRDPPEELVVESESGRITRVGLASWLEQDEREIDEVPEGLQQSWELIGLLMAQVDALSAQCARQEGDIEALLHLGVTQEAAELQALTSSDDESEGVVSTEDIDHSECKLRIQDLERKNQALESSKNEQRRSHDLKTERMRSEHQQKLAKRDQRISVLVPKARRYDQLEEAFGRSRLAAGILELTVVS